MPRHPNHDETISEANKKLRRGEKSETDKGEKGSSGRKKDHALEPSNDDRKSGRKQ